ncbi:hypothetical protein BCR44DRAFT_1424784 [Catenaria anguillulae PL171]|uniref:Uncharacterized protein n=1 Tax=Catenaria anguillulae PL171 TaxID=765915 RepID=A0A1Y2I2U9_9FUNG|nr:hypothetical protein BCR44DRAFT_1431510 [Catenaria anguillulae PL171]ORZ37138.1 hypothetical protein BCR44DRAFT_1431519 [Catenaria anguillulae PL171]ORZ40293.1 hypothetical protein BCR44DRAFT_1424784 [Catenaria anguillulae PL171]
MQLDVFRVLRPRRKHQTRFPTDYTHAISTERCVDIDLLAYAKFLRSIRTPSWVYYKPNCLARICGCNWTCFVCCGRGDSTKPGSRRTMPMSIAQKDAQKSIYSRTHNGIAHFARLHGWTVDQTV